jgi:hypothetical protein
MSVKLPFAQVAALVPIFLENFANMNADQKQKIREAIAKLPTED